ncbi:MAG: S4 domain-containing protein, partial [Pseudomonadota bacterium]|nr:S4 domain-containing protein [Pseudomonadota bacterium]
MAESEIITGTLATRGRLDKALAEASGLSRERVKGLIASGAVEVGGNIITSGSAKIAAGDRFALALPPPEP